jgi:hypothetical protein
MSQQQQRRAQEGQVVRRLTVGAGAAALGLAGYFTVSAANAAPIAMGGQGDTAQQPAAAVQADLSDRVFVRRVHAPAIQAPAGGVRPAGTRTPAQVAPAQVATTQASTAAQPVAAPTAPAAPAPPAATPVPQPTAATGGTKPR